MMAHDSHERFMRRCIELARQAIASADAPVGSLVVRRGLIVGEGIEGVKARHDVTAHAEILALRQACARLATRDLSECVLYTTVEPCIMCAYAIRLAAVGLVVAGTRGSDADAAVNGASVLVHAGVLPARTPPDLLRGVLEPECLAVLAEGRRRADEPDTTRGTIRGPQ